MERDARQQVENSSFFLAHCDLVLKYMVSLLMEVGNEGILSSLNRYKTYNSHQLPLKYLETVNPNLTEI